MAPEILGRKGYSWQIDWWSLGITVYELLFNKRPFDARTAERMTAAITGDALTFPTDITPCGDDALNMMKQVSTLSTHSCRSSHSFARLAPST